MTERFLRDGPALRDLFQTIPDCAIEFDDHLTIVEANREAERLLGFAHDEPIGKRMKLIMPSACASNERLNGSSTLPTLTTRAIRHDGTTIAVELHMTRMVTDAAVDAMRRGGVLDISMACLVVAEDRGAPQVSLAAGEYCVLSVRDTDDGIPPDIRNRVLEPFFTTNQRVEGTGFGLSIVHSALRAISGPVWIDSEVVVGTTIRSAFPPASAGDLPGIGVRAAEPLRGDGRRVLFVDDEFTLLAANKRHLERRSYEVCAVSDARDATVAFRNDPSFDAVVTDFAMPDLDGVLVGASNQGIRNKVPIVLLTGWDEPAEVDGRGRRVHFSRVLRKPVSAGRLATVTPEVLEKRWNESARHGAEQSKRGTRWCRRAASTKCGRRRRTSS